MFESIFEIIPYITAVVFVLGIGFLLFLVYQSRAAPASGQVLGPYEINGRYAGGRFFKRLQGIIVDATGIFLNPELETVFKQILTDDINAVLNKKTQTKTTDKAESKETMTEPNPVQDSESQQLTTLLNNIATMSLPKACRILITRTSLFEKHVIVQYGRINSLPQYAAHEASSRFSISLGPVSKGIINGSILTLPNRWEIYEIGKATVHVFLPDDPQGSKFSDEELKKLPDLAKVALFVPATLSINEQLKSKDFQLKEKDRELANMGRQLSAATTERDALRTALKGFLTEAGQNIEALFPKKLDILDTVILALPTVIGVFITNALFAQPIVGTAAGLLVGIVLVFRRK